MNFSPCMPCILADKMQTYESERRAKNQGHREGSDWFCPDHFEGSCCKERTKTTQNKDGLVAPDEGTRCVRGSLCVFLEKALKTKLDSLHKRLSGHANLNGFGVWAASH